MKPEMYGYFNRIEEKHWWFQARRAIIVALLNFFIGKNSRRNILDIGCGTGMMLKALEPFGNVAGLDFDEQALLFARNKVHEKVELIRGKLPEQLPRGRVFGLVTAFDVIEHVQDDVAAMQAISNILEPGGMFMCTVPAYQFLWSGHDVINEHKRRYTKKELQEKLEKAGFRVMKCSYYNMFLFPVALLFKIYSKFRWGGKPKAHSETVSPAFVNIPFRYIFSSEKFLLPYVNFPFGVSLIAIALVNRE